MHSSPRLVVLTGAGISAESGLPTFRGPGGLWEGHRAEDLATPEAFAAQPELVHRFYNMRRRALSGVEPNPAHQALARLQRDYPGRVVLVTQNVDDLHERAGSTGVIHMHGELRKSRCARCGDIRPCDMDLALDHVCSACDRAGGLRPHVVWFGEMPMSMERIARELAETDKFIAIGTSGRVYPAAGFVVWAREGGARTLEINLEPSDVAGQFDACRTGPAAREVPCWVEEILSQA